MKIHIPHINYTVHVKQIGKLPASLPKALAYTQSDDKNNCTIFLDLKRKILPSLLAHELVHVLQFICEERSIDFVREQEHMGYIMHYLHMTILGNEYI